MYEFTLSTALGCRLPHLWLRDGRSLRCARTRLHAASFRLVRAVVRADLGLVEAAAVQSAFGAQRRSRVLYPDVTKMTTFEAKY